VAKYGTCKVHGTALTSRATCVLCKREEERRRVKRTQRLIFLLAGLTLLVGLAAAGYVYLMPR
jgi:predicted nucleic acid-binding Zn ribbon protein